jgi:hypothetical protein
MLSVNPCLQVEYCFTTEGDDAKPHVMSMRGLDAAIYYRPSSLLNLSHPIVRRLVIDSLQHWATEYHVDGFVFLSAEAMAQDSTGLVLDCPALVQVCHPATSEEQCFCSCSICQIKTACSRVTEQEHLSGYLVLVLA